MLIATSVAGQNPETPPPGIAAPPTMVEVINSTMELYAPQLQNMTELELAAEDKSSKNFMRWRTKMEPRVHPDGTLIDYILMKQNYASNLKSNYESAGDWHELGPYSKPSGLDAIGGGRNGIGPVSWISFDPNFETTNLMFTGGWSTGLWFSEDGGDTWQNGGTDHLPPPISTADGISSHTDEDTWFITTGDGRGSWKKGGTRSTGLFRTTDRGQNWEMIGAPWDFGGANNPPPNNYYHWSWELRKMLLNPESNDEELQLFVTDFNGVYRTNNALGSIDNTPAITNNMAWERIFDYNNVPATYTIDGITYNLSGYDPNGSNNQYIRIYAYDITWGYDNVGIDTDKLIISCSPVYKNANDPDDDRQISFVYISDDKGDTWNMINISAPPIGYYDLGKFDDVGRFSLRTTPANPNLLIMHAGYSDPNPSSGTVSIGRGRVYYYDISSQSWINNVDFTTYDDRVWPGKQAAFAVSPIDENEFYITQHIHLQRTLNGGNAIQSIDAPGKFHVDLEDIEYSPDGSQVWLATHGGPFVYDIANDLWQDKMEGIGNTEVLGFSSSKTNPDRILIGTDHDGSIYASGNVEPNWMPDWKTVGGGDGQECLIDSEEYMISYHTTQEAPPKKNTDAFGGSGTVSVNPPSLNGEEYTWYVNIEANPFNSPSIYVAKTELWRHDNRGESGSLWVNLTDATSGNFNYDDRTFWGIYYSFPSDVNENLLFALVLGREPVHYEDGTPVLDENGEQVYTDIRDLYGCNAAMGTATEAQSAWFRIPRPIGNHTPWYPSVVSDPDDHNVFYTLSGFAPLNNENPQTFKITKFIYNGNDLMTDAPATIETAGFTIEDLTFDFPNLSACDLTIIPGSRDFLAATDMGVFYTNEELMDGNGEVWLAYGENFPYCDIHKMEVNYASNKVRIGTVGRGVWENDLPCDKLDTPIEVSSDVEWDNFRRIRSDIYVLSGATLTISGELQMVPQTLIHVQPNATLILDGGTITSACGDFWGGIQVWGNTDQHQSPDQNGDYYQGRAIFKNDALLENAFNGVTNWKYNDWDRRGGIIQAKDCTFRNCWRAAAFVSYQNFHPSLTNINMADKSYFKLCTFEINDDYPKLNVNPPYAQISLWETDRLFIKGCSFINTSSVEYSEDRSVAIYSHDANYIVGDACTGMLLPCPAQSIIKSNFSGWHKAIEALESNTSRPMKVMSSEFEKNMIGVELAGVNYSQVYENSFDLGNHELDYSIAPQVPDLANLGIHSKSTSVFSIEQNTFQKATGGQYEGHGVLVFNSKDFNNAIYNNTFTNLKTAANGWQINRNVNAIGGVAAGLMGLQFLCNTNSGNEVDFEMSSTLDEFNLEHELAGMRRNQGDYSPTMAAGNTFSTPSADPNIYTHWTVAVPEWHRYFYHNNSPSTGEIISEDVFLIEYSENDHQCPTNYSTGKYPNVAGVINGIRNQFQALQYTYSQVIDDGKTEEVLNEIALTWPEDAWDLRNQLMARSPYNSEEVLFKAADREVMPHAMLLEVLLANPDALKSGKVIQFVKKELSNPMPEYMIDLLLLARDESTLRTAMENNLATMHEEISKQMKIAVGMQALDSAAIATPDSVLYFMSRINTPVADYARAAAMADRGQHTEAIALIDSVMNNYRLLSFQLAEAKLIKGFHEFVENVENDGRNIANLDSTEITSLQVIAENPGGGLAAMKAQNALCFHYQICYKSNGKQKSLIVKPYEAPSKEDILEAHNTARAFPNPSDQYVTIAYNLLSSEEDTQINIFNVDGRLMRAGALGENYEGQYLIDTRGWPTGLYFYNIFQNGEKIISSKFTVTH